MATIVNTPAATEHVAQSDSSSMMNLFIGVIVILMILGFFFYFGLPMMRSAAAPAQVPQIKVPDKVDVNVNPNGGAPAK